MKALTKTFCCMVTLAGIAAAAGCGAMFNGGPATVHFTSTPDGADVWVNGSPRGKTPIILELAKNQNHTVLFKKEGYGDFAATINRKVSAGYVILDVLGGILPVVIDAATGSWYSLNANTLHGALATQASEPPSGQLTLEQLNLIKLGMSLDQVLNQP
jgi:hypothetical protein